MADCGCGSGLALHRHYWCRFGRIFDVRFSDCHFSLSNGMIWAITFCGVASNQLEVGDGFTFHISFYLLLDLLFWVRFTGVNENM